MLVIFFVASLFILSGNCDIIPKNPQNDKILTCLINITQKYYADIKKLTYVNPNEVEDGFLRHVHALNIVSVITRTAPADTATQYNLAYMLVTINVKEFIYNFHALQNEFTWNPYARFLIMIKSVKKDELRRVFDVLLRFHVNNAVVVNGTATAELYTYNPYENYACGKYYTEITEFGKCLEVTEDIYPYKIVTGLRKCFFNVSVPHWPPYGIDPAKIKKGTKYIPGVEQYIFKLISKIEQFKYKFRYDYDPELFSVVTRNMTVSGPMTMLLTNQTDIMLGGLILIPSRAQVFFYIYGHLDQVDEIRLFVKKAWETPAWKDLYLEFSPRVWAMLLLALAFYSAIIIALLRTEDRVSVVLTLLDTLLSHGPKLKCRGTVNVVFIIWVWFAYLFSGFYTTSLMGLTTSPNMDYQIKDEKTITERGLEPCISDVMDRYRNAESNHRQLLNDIKAGVKGCEKYLESIRTVSESKHKFTMGCYSIYLYYKFNFYNEYGKSPIFSLPNPYSKVIYAMYLNKGFPMYERLHMLALRIRETGLTEKSLRDHYQSQMIRYHFKFKGFVSRGAVPWHIYIIGVFISTVTFAVELASQYKQDKQNVQYSP